MPIQEVAVIALIGLIAGAIGGLAGVGGSIIMLPALHVVWPLFHKDESPQLHHVFMAAAMIVNVAVSLPAAIQHHRAGAVRLPALRVLLPSASVAVLVGVSVSNLFDGDGLRLLLALFLVGYTVWNAMLIIRPRRRSFEGQGRVERLEPARLAGAGLGSGFVGGVLGLGGGFLLVPLLQILCNVRLKNAIATSSAVLCVSAAIGAALKVGTLPQHGEPIMGAVRLAAIMAPTGVLGALAGAKWLHDIPVTVVRVVLAGLILTMVIRVVG